jgi:hypothetical protein
MQNMESAPPAAASTEPIVCRVTPWYFRRLGMMSAMLMGMGLYFLYDGKYGYPKANEIAAQKDWFEQTVLKGYDDAKAANRLDAWVKETEAQGLPAGKNGEPPRWVSYAAERGWPEKPHKYTDREITEQFWWGGGTLLMGLLVGINMLLNRKKILSSAGDHWVTPEGKTVYFANVFRVDKRKWDNKGLAYAWYRETDGGPEKKAVIDDLKFDGAARILDRLIARFKGELIEKIPDAPASNSVDTPPPNQPL